MARYSEAQNKASQRYQKKAYDTTLIRMPKGYMAETLKPAAESVGESVNGFITTAITERIERISTQGVIPDFDDPPEETIREPVDFGA